MEGKFRQTPIMDGNGTVVGVVDSPHGRSVDEGRLEVAQMATELMKAIIEYEDIGRAKEIIGLWAEAFHEIMRHSERAGCRPVIESDVRA